VSSGAPEHLALISADPAPEPSSGFEPTDAQRAAIASRGRDVFTEAGAGSGKTGVLVERYCDCVTEDGVGPEAILAFTFTERAAGELRRRVRRRLMDRAHAAADRGDAERAAEIARAAREGERAWITTIHGFCRRLLAAHPVAARLDPRFRVLDASEAARLAEGAFDIAVEEVVAEKGAGAARFVAGFSGRRLRELGVDVHERLRSQGVDPPRLPNPGHPVRSVKEKGDVPELTPDEAQRATEGFEALSALLTAYDRHYARLKAERSGVDFADLELRALELLRTGGSVAEAWRERFTHLMVDEYQDTNRVQLELIHALRGPETRLFVVGDEFQSIYRFRHADLDVFREQRAAATGNAEVDELPLRGNFRSRPDVLAAVDFLGEALFDEAFAPLEAGLDAGGEPAGGGPATELLVTDTADDREGGWRAEEIDLDPPPGEDGPACVAEARFLAQRLRELNDRGVERGNMVVLLRAFTHVDAFEEALDRAGLEPYVVGGRGYWSQQQVEDALRLLGVVTNPLDDELLFGALASPACGVSPDALWILRQGARDEDGHPEHVWPLIEEAEWPETLPEDDVPRLERFRAVVRDLRAEAPLRPLDSLVDRVISAFDYDLTTLAMKGGERRMANLRKLMRLAAEYEEHDGRDLRGFLDFAEERTRRDEREGMAAIQVEGHDGVRVMTVHAAKGLEFPVVAVADLGRWLGAGFSNPGLVVGRLPGPVGDPEGARLGMRLPVAGGESLRLWELVELSGEEAAAEVSEALRLVYVAASRAQERLILSGTCGLPVEKAPESPRPSTTALQILLPALRELGWSGEDGDVLLPRAPAVGGGVAAGGDPLLRVAIQRPSAQRAERLRTRAEVADPPLVTAPEPASPLLSGTPPPPGAGHLSYSALAGYAACGYRFYAERILGLASPLEAAADVGETSSPEEDPADELIDPQRGPRQRSLAIGNAVHAILEAGARRSWGPAGSEEVERILVREGLAGDAEARDRVGMLVEGWLASDLRAELASDGARLRPEVPFILDLGGAIVRGKIDLLADTPAGPLVVDYKPDALGGADPAELASRYETQRDLYAVAVQRASGGRPDPVRAAYCFLEAPDRTVLESYDEAGVRAAGERLEGLIQRIRDGEFARTDSPHRSLCHGCPAAARLCGAPAWKPGWAGV
jgi:ATP-dependent exoDNAse (exonuclease V) beta subunit